MNTNLMKCLIFQTVSQTAIALDQHAMIPASLVVMALFSISMARATNSSAQSQTETSRSMVASVATGQRIEPATTLGFKPWECFSALTVSLQKPPKWVLGTTKLNTYNGNDVVLEEAYLSTWYFPEKDVKVERISSRNSVIVSLKISLIMAPKCNF